MFRILSGIRYSARSFARTPGLALALVFTIALGIGSNVCIHGFARGLIERNSPLTAIQGLVSLFGQDARRNLGPVSYEDYLLVKKNDSGFEWIGAARVSQSVTKLADQSAVLSVAAVTPDLAALLNLPLDDGVVLSRRVWQNQFRTSANARSEQVRIDGVDARVNGVAPDWLEGVYRDRPVDVWMHLRDETLMGAARSSRNFWLLGRLRQGASFNPALPKIRVLPYTGITPEAAAGLSRVAALLGLAAGAVFLIACANVASFLLGRASARSHESTLRVALGASRDQLARELLCDSAVISFIGGACGMLLAMWTARIIPALLFEQDAGSLVFAPDLYRIAAASATCIGIMVACGLLPVLTIPDDRPATVLRRESAGPSKAVRRLRAGLVVAQMTSCFVLVVSAAFLLNGLRSALQTTARSRLGQPILATVQADLLAGMTYFRHVEFAARSMAGVSAKAWAAQIPGSRPVWRSFHIDPARLALRAVAIDTARFPAGSLDLLRLPPAAGRLFSFGDEACRVAVVNQEAAEALFDRDTVGRSIQDPAGLPVEIIGVLATPKLKDAKRNRATIYYHPEQPGSPSGRVGLAPFRAPIASQLATAELNANVVSTGYFDSLGLSLVAGEKFADGPTPGVCRVGMVNQEAANLYFGGNAVGAAVIDVSGRRTQIIGVVHSPPLVTFQRSVEPTIYFPMEQDYIPRMTLILGAQQVDESIFAELRRRIGLVPGRGPAPPIVKTLDAHLSQTALAPLRIAAILVGASATIAIILSILGLYGALNDAARQRRREFAIRIALGARRRHVISEVLWEGGRFAAAGTLAGIVGSLLLMRLLGRIVPGSGSPALWVWLAPPLVLFGAVAVASARPARRALIVDPLTIMRDDNG